MHHLAHADAQIAPQLTRRMALREVFRSQFSGLHDGQREGVSEGRRNRCACGGSKVIRIGFRAHGGIEQNVHLFSERRRPITYDPDQARIQSPQDRYQTQQFERRSTL